MNEAMKQDTDMASKLIVYSAVWAALLILTVVTVAAASLHLGKVAIIVCLAIAATKATFVLLYFMHLRHEGRLVIRLIIPSSIITLTIFIGLTFSDILTR